MRYEPSHLDLHCSQRNPACWSAEMKWLTRQAKLVADDILYFFIFVIENNSFSFHVNRLLGRRFICNVKTYFIWKIKKEILKKCRLLQLLRSVNIVLNYK